MDYLRCPTRPDATDPQACRLVKGARYNYRAMELVFYSDIDPGRLDFRGYHPSCHFNSEGVYTGEDAHGVGLESNGPSGDWLDIAVRHYLAAALWASVDGEGNALDSEFDIDGVSEESYKQARLDMENMMVKAWDIVHHLQLEPESFGHDFWLTRNLHGSGFWDRGYGEQGKQLTSLAHSFPELHAFVSEGRTFVDFE